MVQYVAMMQPTTVESPTFSPLYRQIKGLILQALENREWRPGEVIPSEIELAARFNVSQGTVRKAIDEMAAENLLVRRQGKGTYVASHSDPMAAEKTRTEVGVIGIRMNAAAASVRPV